MLTTVVTSFILIFSVTYGRVLLYNTENDQSVEKFDCVYYTHGDGEEISYCRRPGENESLSRNQKVCNNQGEGILFRDLLNQKIAPNDILKWSSSVELADIYASVFYNQSVIDANDDRFVCNCTQSGTFGKYCEYKFTHSVKTFGDAIKAQFRQKEDGDSWNTQRYGNILCYETLSCHSSPLCLDWQEICDSVQRCLNSIDEENCDKLEFNECKDDEFRCTNGMCIAEEFWLDGDYDCMDWSDEYLLGVGASCPFEPDGMKCDEHICPKNMYSCGDGECVPWHTRMAFQRFANADPDCFTKRNLNYMCETSPHQSAWTLESGLCWPDKRYDDPRYPDWNMINSSKLTDVEKCQYLFRCVWSKGFERDCPCNHRNCTKMMMSVCSKSNSLILYPPYGLINPNFRILYDYNQLMENPTFQIFQLSGGLKCRGYFLQTKEPVSLRIQLSLIASPVVNQLLCTVDDPTTVYRDFLSPFKNDKFCWNDSLTFNSRPYAVNPDVCNRGKQCISQYRIRDGFDDCLSGEDEKMMFEKIYCTDNVARHRFQCLSDEHKCLTLSWLGTGQVDCSNSFDESWYGIGASLRRQMPCFKELTADCHRVKDYIQQSSPKNSTNYTSLIDPQRPESADRMRFRLYCNSFWDSEKHNDEIISSCQHWICENDQYQCRTGQCIALDWVCDGEWDCADASDEESIVLIEKWSSHNAHVPNLSFQREKCRERYSKSPFSRICNTSFEFGCYLSGVSDPLDIELNRPCINLNQIGDDVEDCYNAYDERNTFTANSQVTDMWGFHFRCGEDHKLYSDACNYVKNNCTEILCSKYRDKDGSCSNTKDFICLGDDHCKKNARCNGKPDCPHREDEYWCSTGSVANQLEYRFDKKQLSDRRDEVFLPILYPPESILQSKQQQVSKSIINLQNRQFFEAYSYQCNRGVAVLQINNIQCLCPPAYYGRQCEFYSDRITIIAYLDQKTLPKTISNITLKIKANYFFNNRIIDYHEFHVVPVFERAKIIKHKFYLLYSRSNEMLAHKKERYYNRTDVINNHPYSVHFDVFALTKNNSVEELGSWHYPVYFDYLPAFRLAIVLRFPSWFRNATLDPCWASGCNENSTCMPIFNQNNSYYCSCKSGYYGTDCNMYESRCKTYCLSSALCRPDGKNVQTGESKPYCICTLGHFGPRCNLNYDECDRNACLNNGTCLVRYDRSGEKPYACVCTQRFDGSRCQHAKASVHVDLNITKTLSARAAVVQLYDFIFPSLTLVIRHQQVYDSLPSTISYCNSRNQAPVLGILKIYESLLTAQYFMIYMLKRRVINITSSPQHCPYALLLLFEETNRSVPAVFTYHHICRNNIHRYCFHDKNYFCICQSDHRRVDCFIHDIHLDHCTKCLSGAKCLQGDPNDPNDFTCFCPSCHQGRQCEFGLHAFGFTLDSLLVNSSKQIRIVYVSMACLLFIVGLFNNLCSFMTFKRPTPRKFGVGNYLLITTCLNQIALLCLLIKFIQTTVTIPDLGSCKAVSYFLSVFTRSNYWLTSWITVDRLLMIFFRTLSSPKNPRLAIRMSIVTVMILFGMHVHEIIYFTIIRHLPTGSPICVTNFDTRLISTYDRISTLIHYLFPFFIQVICITFLIILTTRSRAKTAGQKMNFGQMLKKQFQTQKELYITPSIIILSTLPQAILTFTFACTQMTDWQRHSLLGSYLISYAPQVLGFILFVIPSTSYKKEFLEAILTKKYFKWMFDKKQKAIRHR